MVTGGARSRVLCCQSAGTMICQMSRGGRILICCKGLEFMGWSAAARRAAKCLLEQQDSGRPRANAAGRNADKGQGSAAPTR